MASSSGNTNPLIAGVGAFAVVIGGLAMYKRYAAKPAASSSAHRANVGILAPDVEAVTLTPSDMDELIAISPQEFMSVAMPRAMRMVGRTTEELLGEYGDNVLVTSDSSVKRQHSAELNDSAFLLPMALTRDGGYTADIGFYSNHDGRITHLVAITGGHDAAGEVGALGTAIIGQADLHWQPGVLERNVEHGLALRYTTGALGIIATHRLAADQWRFNISPIKKSDDLGGLGTIGMGRHAAANCDVVGRSPTHLGIGKLFTLNQSQQAALATIKRLAPDQAWDNTDTVQSFALGAGLPGLMLSVQTAAGKVQSLRYYDDVAENFSNQRHSEFLACWDKPVASVDDITYWRVGNERYRLSTEELDIARFEQVQNVVKRLADGIDKPYSQLADLEANEIIANTPDWPADTNLFLDGDAVNVVAVETVIGFGNNPARRAQLLQEIERGLGAGTLIRNDVGAPVLQYKTKRAIIDVQPMNPEEMDIMVNHRDAAKR